jgi:hypothetical protein
MKRLLFAFLFLMLAMSPQAHAQFEYPDGWSLGTIKPQGISYPVSSNTTNQTLTVYQTGSTLVFTGTSNNTQFTLPLCQNSLGLDYTFIDDTTKYIAVIPQPTDTINIASTVQGQGVNNSSSTAIGNNITLICRSSNQWSIEGTSGTWATGN